MSTSRVLLANLLDPYTDDSDVTLIKSTKPKSPKKEKQQLKLSNDPCERLYSATNQTLAVPSAAITLDNSNTELPNFDPSIDRDRIVKKTHQLKETLKHVNYSVYFQEPRPDYNTSRDLLFELSEASRNLNYLLCSNEEGRVTYGDYSWLYLQLYELKNQFNASLPDDLVSGLHILGVNMTTHARGRAITAAKANLVRMLDITKELKERCTVIECASTVNYSLYPPRIHTLAWLYQQLNYTMKVLNTTLPVNLTDPLIWHRTDLDFKWNSHKPLFDPKVDWYRSWNMRHVVNEINNCNTMACINNISLESVLHTPYDINAVDNNTVIINTDNTVSFVNSDDCPTALFCTLESQSQAFAAVLFFLLLAMCVRHRPLPCHAAAKLSDTLPAGLISKALQSGKSIFARVKAVTSDEENSEKAEMGMTSSINTSVVRR
jgi:hypothetical protein